MAVAYGDGNENTVGKVKGIQPVPQTVLLIIVALLAFLVLLNLSFRGTVAGSLSL